MDLDNRFRCLSIRNEKDDLTGIFDAVVQIYKELERGYQGRQLNQTCLSRMQGISQIYRHQLQFTYARVDFFDIFTQWAYMYLFMMRHVHLVFHAMDVTVQERLIRVDPRGKPPRICMIGGGPGSDVLGLSVFLRKHGCTISPVGQVDVLDKCSNWSWAWTSLHRHLPPYYRNGIPAVKYRQFDYQTNILSVENQSIVSEADIITMIKSLSPVAAWLKNVQPSHHYTYKPNGFPRRTLAEWHSVYSILKHMKPGAFLLYIDNHTGPQREILMEAVRCLNFKVMFQRVFRQLCMPTDIFSLNARVFNRSFGYKPCTTAGTNEVILLKKIS